jgi:hypothetical protein
MKRGLPALVENGGSVSSQTANRRILRSTDGKGGRIVGESVFNLDCGPVLDFIPALPYRTGKEMLAARPYPSAPCGERR